jgi:acetyltransferase-like isoleucine patch superfamily enzyme
LDARTRIDYPRCVRIGSHVHFEADTWIKLVSGRAQVSIGDYCFLGRGTEIDVSEGVTMGSHVLLAPGVFITDHVHNVAAGRLIDTQGVSSQPVRLGDDVWVGAGAIVLPGVAIGNGAVIGAGAVVTRAVAAGAIVAGVPARVLRHRG